MQDVMIDLETLDTRSTAVILSIGAVRFGPEEIGPTFHQAITIESNLDVGRTVSGSTLMWWLDQDALARKAVINAVRQPLSDVLNQLSKFIKPTDKVWGNGASFDNSIIANAYQCVGLPLPWQYWNDRCFRTMKATYNHAPKPPFVGTEHDALDDAVNQAEHLQEIWRYIKV